MQRSMKFVVAMALLCQLAVNVSGGGVKDYGDSCNVISSGVQIFETLGGGENNYKGACDVDKGLVCLGTCTCLPNQYYQQNFLERLVGGGRCTSGSASLNFSISAILLVLIPILTFWRA